jgi:hypothetical protein
VTYRPSSLITGAGMPPAEVVCDPVELTLTRSVAPSEPAPASVDGTTKAAPTAAAATAHLRRFRPARALLIGLFMWDIPSTHTRNGLARLRLGP